MNSIQRSLGKKINWEEIRNRVRIRHPDSGKTFPRKETQESDEDKELRLAKHLFQRLYPWNSIEEFAETICQNVIYNSDGIVAVNKPFGVGLRNVARRIDETKERLRTSGKEIKKSTVELDQLHSRGTGYSQYCLEDALPLLRQKLHLPKLHLVKGGDKFSSGVTIFGTDESSSQRIGDGLKRNKPLGLKTFTFRIISTNISSSLPTNYGDIFSERVGIKMIQNEALTTPQAIIIKDFSKKRILSGEVQPVNISLSLLAKNSELNVCSTKIRSSSIRRNFLRLYYSSIASPILGDHIFSCRLGRIGGHIAPVPLNLIPPHPRYQELSTQIISTLRLKTLEDSLIVPLHAHLSSLCIGNFHGNGKHLHIIAPSTKLFDWTLTRLCLKSGNESIESIQGI